MNKMTTALLFFSVIILTACDQESQDAALQSAEQLNKAATSMIDSAVNSTTEYTGVDAEQFNETTESMIDKLADSTQQFADDVRHDTAALVEGTSESRAALTEQAQQIFDDAAISSNDIIQGKKKQQQP